MVLQAGVYLKKKPRSRRKSGEWHHRVPDFKLVYCGPKTTLGDLRKANLKQGKSTHKLKASQ